MLQKLDLSRFHSPPDPKPVQNQAKSGVLVLFSVLLLLCTFAGCIYYYSTQIVLKNTVNATDDVDHCSPIGSYTINRPSPLSLVVGLDGSYHTLKPFALMLNFQPFQTVPEVSTLTSLAFKATNGDFVAYLRSQGFHWYCFQDKVLLLPPVQSAWFPASTYAGLGAQDITGLCASPPPKLFAAYCDFDTTNFCAAYPIGIIQDGGGVLTSFQINTVIDDVSFNFMQNKSQVIQDKIRSENAPYYCTVKIPKNQPLDIFSLSLAPVLTLLGILTSILQFYNAKWNSDVAKTDMKQAGNHATRVVPL